MTIRFRRGVRTIGSAAGSPSPGAGHPGDHDRARRRCACRWRAPWCPAGSGFWRLRCERRRGAMPPPRSSPTCPEAVVGIGTVLTPQDLDRSRDARRAFRAEPRRDPGAARRGGGGAICPSCPGIATASELMAALGPRLRHRQVLSGGAGRRHRRAQGAGRTVPAGPLLPDGRRERGQRGRMARSAERRRGRRLLAHPGCRDPRRRVGSD